MRLHFLAAAALAAVAFRASPGQSLDARIDAHLRQLPGGAFNGVIAVARDGKTILTRAYGVADADLATPNQPDSRFGIGSLTKPITAAAALRLVELGRLQLGDSICKYLRTCPGGWNAATIEHLLSHTSGIPDLFNDLPAARVDSTRDVVDAVIANHEDLRLRSPPGERYAYNNFGYFLIGYAIEVATGRSWESVLSAEVFDRAGMRSTEYDDVWRVMPRRARGYVAAHDSLRHIRYRDHSAYAAGGLLSSAADLLRFDNALQSGALLADSTRRLMFTVRQGEYALGWQITTVFGRSLRNHTGGTNGFSSWLGHFDGGLTVIVLRNVEGAAGAKALGCDIAALALGLEPSPRGSGQSSCRARP